MNDVSMQRRLPGSGMPPSHAPQFGMPVQPGRAIGGGNPPPIPQQRTQGLDPMALMMLMRMLLPRQGQGGGAGPNERAVLAQLPGGMSDLMAQGGAQAADMRSGGLGWLSSLFGGGAAARPTLGGGGFGIGY